MCGIFGYIQKKSRKVDNETVCSEMINSLKHRGPNEQNYIIQDHNDLEIVFGHTRLTIRDKLHGHQPQHKNCDLFTYNGEVYNHKEILNGEFGQIDTEIKSSCDTEVVFELLLKQGKDSLSNLNGMFALALWKESSQSLLLARDHIGIKPLFYCEINSEEIVFASELKTLLIHPLVPKKICPKGLSSYLFTGYTQHPTTIFKGIKKLPPGTSFTFSPKKCSSLHTFKSFNYTRGKKISALEISDTINGAVKRQLVSDVPIGILLSGGLDSSIVAYEAKKFKSNLKTFSLSFDSSSFDESKYAKQVSSFLQTDHTDFKFDESILKENIVDIMNSYHEPIADHSVLPCYYLFKETKKHVTVVLSGDGGDELFGGYPTYQAHKISTFFTPLYYIKGISVINFLISFIPAGEGYLTLEWKAKRFFDRWLKSSSKRHLNWMSYIDFNTLKKVYDMSISNLWELYYMKKDNILDIMQIDRLSYLPNSILSKVDTTSMQHSLEVRPVLLDESLLKVCQSMLPKQALNKLRTKEILKKAYKDKLPKNIVFRKKHGFSVPLNTWIKGPLNDLVQNSVNDAAFFDAVFLRQSYFKNVYKSHMEGLSDHSRVLWAITVLRWYLRNNIDFFKKNINDKSEN